MGQSVSFHMLFSHSDGSKGLAFLLLSFTDVRRCQSHNRKAVRAAACGGDSSHSISVMLSSPAGLSTYHHERGMGDAAILS